MLLLHSTWQQAQPCLHSIFRCTNTEQLYSDRGPFTLEVNQTELTRFLNGFSELENLQQRSTTSADGELESLFCRRSLLRDVASKRHGIRIQLPC